MTSRLRIRKDAEYDLERLHDWYETLSPGLGTRLILDLEPVLDILEESPLIYADIHRGVRRAVLKTFPVGVYFKCVDDLVHVIAIDHLARDPEKWKGRA